MKKENNKNENKGISIFSKDKDYKPNPNLLKVSDYIYNKLGSRWGIFLISLLYLIYISIYILDIPTLGDKTIFYIRDIFSVICLSKESCISFLESSFFIIGCISIPIFLYSTIFLFYKNKEKFEKWRLFTFKYLLFYIFFGYLSSQDNGYHSFGPSAIEVFLFISLPLYLIFSILIFSKKLFAIISISIIIILTWYGLNAQELPPTEENIILNINSTSTPNISRIKYNSIMEVL